MRCTSAWAVGCFVVCSLAFVENAGAEPFRASALAKPIVSSAATALSSGAVQLRERIHKALSREGSLEHFFLQLSKEDRGATVAPLLELANRRGESDEIRRTALFALGRTAGKESLGIMRNFLTHPNWMLRDAALRTAAALDAREMAPLIEARLHDQALVVRTTAVQAIGHLGLTQSAPKLVDALFDRANYNGDTALWIHRHILAVLRSFDYRPALPRLLNLLGTARDPTLKKDLAWAVESLSAKTQITTPGSRELRAPAALKHQ